MTGNTKLAVRVEENLTEFFRRIAAAQLNGCRASPPGLQLISTGIDNPLFNVAVLERLNEDSEDAFRQALETASLFFAPNQIRFSVWFSHFHFEDRLRRHFPAWFAARGFRPSSRLVGMARENPLRRPSTHPPLLIRPLSGAADLDAFCRITAESFRFPLFWCRALYGVPKLWSDGFRGYLAFFEDQPVSAAAVLVTSGASGIYCVGTLPPFRRRGFAHAVVSHAAAEAALHQGATLTLLQCAPYLAAMYRQLGFQEVSRLDAYVQS